jgi:hypothetical protein
MVSLFVVSAQNCHIHELLDGGDTCDDGVVLRELLRGDPERDRHYGGLGDGIPPIRRSRMLSRPMGAKRA